jgi:hypothetical protein
MDVRCGGRHLAAVFPRFRHRSTAVPHNLAHQNRPKYRTASSVALDSSSNELLVEPSHQIGLGSKTVAKPHDGAEPSATDNFLEPEDEEYHRVVLPRRPLKPIVIPWPTLLPHHETDSASSSSAYNDTPREPVVYLPSSAKVTLAEVTSKREQGLVIHPCEALSKAVCRKDWETADQLLKELEDLGIPIRPEEVYIQGAVQQLRSVATLSSRRSVLSGGNTMQRSEMDMIQSAKSTALRYLSHYPVLPIHRRLSMTRLKVLQPFFTIAMDHNHTADLEFTERLLRICASKGLLRMTLHTGLFRDWCERVETVRGYKVMTELVETAWLSTSSLEGRYRGQGEREENGLGDEETGRVALMKLGASLRNVHLRTLIHVATRKLQRLRQFDESRPGLTAENEDKEGRDALDLAKSVYIAGSKVGVRWDPKTKKVMVHALRWYDSPRGDVGLSDRPRAKSRGDPDLAQYLRDAVNRRKSASGMVREEMSVSALARETRRVVRGRAHLPLSDLVEVLAQLEHKGNRQSLTRRMKERFVGPEKFRQVLPWAITETTKSFWHMAQVTKLKKQGKLGEAIGTYKEEFLWHGLPSLDGLALIQPVEPGELGLSKRKLRPTSHAITGVLDAILQNLDPSQRGQAIDLHTRYADKSSGSSTSDLTLDRASHLPFVLGMIRSDGPHKTQQYLEQLEAHGVYPGVPCWTALASEFAKRGYSRRASAILAAHPIFPKAALMTKSNIEADKSGLVSAIKPDQKRGTPRMYAAVAAMHFRNGRLWRAKEVIGKMQAQNLGIRGPCIRSARSRWMRSRDKASS